MKEIMIGGLFACLLLVGVVSAGYYPQTWTQSYVIDSGMHFGPVASGEIHYRIGNGIEILDSSHLPNGLPGFTDFWWAVVHNPDGTFTAPECGVQLDEYVMGEPDPYVYIITRYDAVLRDIDGNELARTFLGCPLYGNPADFTFDWFPDANVEHELTVWYEETLTGTKVAYAEMTIGSENIYVPPEPEPDPTPDECNPEYSMDYSICKGFFLEDEYLDYEWVFENEWSSLDCYRECKYTNNPLPFDNCADYYGVEYRDDRYGNLMTKYLSGKYYYKCEWGY